MSRMVENEKNVTFEQTEQNDEQEVIDRLRSDFQQFNDISHKYENKEISAKEYKSVSQGFGDYLQRDNHQMLRIRIPGGRMTPDMVGTILDVCGYYDIEAVKISTGQALQLHDLSPHEGRRLILRLLDAGIVTRGSGGDNPNNITASALSGVERGEYFDVQPYAKAADEYLLRYTGTAPLPRKFKIGFASAPTPEIHATMKDIGFLANRDHTFDVYAAGGLGIRPMLGLRVAEHVPPEKMLYHLRTMLDIYMENGNYKSRGKARSRFLQETMGVDGFTNAYRAHLQEVMEEGQLDLHVTEPVVTKTGDGSTARGFRVIPQRQEGLYAVSYHPAGGYLPLDHLKDIYTYIKDRDGMEIRLATTGGLYIINCTGNEANDLLKLTEGGAESDIENSVCCVGHTRCDIGPADSQGLLADCLDAVRKEHFSPHTLPRMRISGCPSSCAAQNIAAIGWRGLKRKDADGTPKDAYFFSYGGSAVPGHENLADGKIILFADQIPAFLVELGRRVEKTGLSFSQWLPDHEEELVELAKKYAI